MRYLLVVLEDETTIRPDPDLFAFTDEAPDPRNAAACLDRILAVCDPDALGKRAVIEIEPDSYVETERRNGDFHTQFHLSIEGKLEP